MVFTLSKVHLNHFGQNQGKQQENENTKMNDSAMDGLSVLALAGLVCKPKKVQLERNNLNKCVTYIVNPRTPLLKIPPL